MNIYFLTLMVFSCISLGIAYAKHGQPQAKYNAWVALISVSIQMILTILAINAGW